MSAVAGVEDRVRGPRAVVPSVPRYVALVVAGVAILQLLWIAVVPPFRGSDEFDHAYRAAGVASGQWRATESPEDGRGLLVEAPEALVRAAHAQCDSLNYTRPDNCSPVRDLGGGEVLVASGAGGYNPLFYAAVGVVATPFDGVSALYAMRVAAALLCLLFIGLAAWSVGVRRAGKWSRAALVVALTPVFLYSTSLPAPNGLEMAAGLALWCSLLTLGAGGQAPSRERGLLWIAVASCFVLMVGRLLGPFFALLIVATVWLLHPGLVRRVVTGHPRGFAMGSSVVLGGAAWAFVWNYLHSLVPYTPEKQGGAWEWSDLVQWPLQTIAAFPFRDQPGPTIVYPVVLLAFGTLVFASLRVGRGRDRFAQVLTLVVAFGLPVLLTVLTYDGRGVMWQGRYGLPFAIGTVLVAGSILDDRRWVTRWWSGMIAIGGSLLGVSVAACYLKVVDMEMARAVSSQDPSWLAPGGGVVVVATLVAWLLLYRASARTDHALA